MTVYWGFEQVINEHYFSSLTDVFDYKNVILERIFKKPDSTLGSLTPARFLLALSVTLLQEKSKLTVRRLHLKCTPL